MFFFTSSDYIKSDLDLNSINFPALAAGQSVRRQALCLVVVTLPPSFAKAVTVRHLKPPLIATQIIAMEDFIFFSLSFPFGS